MQMKASDKSVVGKGRTFDEALKAAIAEGERNFKGPTDGVIKWTIGTISGRSGGMFGQTEITVEIRVADAT